MESARKIRELREKLINSLQDRIAYYNAFDEYHVKHNLSVMENLFARYINARLDMYLDML